MDKVTRQCPHTTTFEEKGEPNRNRTGVLLLTSLTPYRYAKPAHNIHRNGIFFIRDEGNVRWARSVCGGGGGITCIRQHPSLHACLQRTDLCHLLQCCFASTDPTVYQGRGAQYVHLDFHTALSSNPCQAFFLVCMRYAHSNRRLLAGSRRKRRRGALTVKSVSVSQSEP